MATEARAQPLAGRIRWVAGLGATARRILDLGLPPLCPTCREPVADPGAVCSQCWSKLTFISRPYCERLGIPFAYDPGPGVLSMEAIADPPSYNRARAAVRYDETARTMVQAFKYGDRLDLAPAMGRWMATAGASCWAKPMRLFRSRCIGAGCGRAGSIRPPRSRKRFPASAVCRSPMICSSACGRRASRSA
jgi:Double zinc ribbon domain